MSSSARPRCAGCSRRAHCAPTRGLPATILSRGLLTFAFFGADAYVTLTITTVRGHSTLMAGAVVTASTLAWTVGSWVQARLNDRWEGARLVRTGLVLILVGTAGMAWQLRPGVPVGEAFVAWSVAGFGMGLSYAPISLMMLRAAPPGREGWASASLNLADVLGIALGVGIGGAAVAAFSRGPGPSQQVSSSRSRWPRSPPCSALVIARASRGRWPAGSRRPQSIAPRMSRSQASAACHAASACRRCSGPCSPAAGYEPRNFTPARPAWRSRRQSATTSSPT